MVSQPPTTVYSEVSVALITAQPDIPPVISALRALGLRNETISKEVGVSASMSSLWSRGREPIAASHYPKLVRLLRLALGEAIRALGEVAAKANSPEVERAFRSYRDRVRLAGDILQELER